MSQHYGYGTYDWHAMQHRQMASQNFAAIASASNNFQHPALNMAAAAAAMSGSDTTISASTVNTNEALSPMESSQKSNNKNSSTNMTSSSRNNAGLDQHRAPNGSAPGDASIAGTSNESTSVNSGDSERSNKNAPGSNSSRGFGINNFMNSSTNGNRLFRCFVFII